MTLTALLEALAENEIPVFYDGQHVRLRPRAPLADEMVAAVKAHRDRLVWMCLNRIRPDADRPAWEFWFRYERWLDFCMLKAKGEK